VWITEWLTFASEEMLWKSCAEKFLSEALRCLCAKKYAHAQARIFFNGANLPLASAPLYSRPFWP
jgi:hypothetical protein